MPIPILNKADSLAQADSLTPVQAEIAEVVKKITETPAEELISNMVDKALAFGLKVLFAILLYIVGAWLIRKIKRMATNIFERRNSDAAIVSFIQSIISIVLTVMLVIIVVGTLGIDTSSYSFSYLKSWMKDPKEIGEIADCVQKISSKIIQKKLDKFFVN